MAHVCSTETNPFIIGEDFNIMRRPEEKNNNNFDPRWSGTFNAIIDTLDLPEIETTGRQYT
jgi:hypothetical protein